MDSNSPMKAFTYMFDDNKFWQKYWTLFGLNILLSLFLFIKNDFTPTNTELQSTQQPELVLGKLFIVLICSILHLILILSLGGYFINTIKAFTEQKGNLICPFYNFPKTLKSGFKVFIAGILFTPILIIPGIVLALLLPTILQFNNIILTIISCILCIICGLIILYLYPAFYRHFSVTQKLTAFYNFKEIFNSIKQDRINYRNYILTLYGSSIVIISIAFLFSCIFFLLIQNEQQIDIVLEVVLSIISPYWIMQSAYLYAKCVKEPEQIEENAQ